MKENAVETYLVHQLESIGCECWKFTSPGRAGVADRLVIPPLGLSMEFVETKAPDRDLEPLQAYNKRALEKRGQRTSCIDTKAKVDRYVAEMRRAIHLRAEHLASRAA